jgi:hypothetical protein
MLLNVFEDVVLRLYSRVTDARFIENAGSLFKRWAIENKLPAPVYGHSYPDSEFSTF